MHIKKEGMRKKWYFVTKIVVTYCEKTLFYWLRKTIEIQGWSPRICKYFEITRTICSNSERSEQFLATECFFNLFLEVPQNTNWKKKILEFRNMQEMLEKSVFCQFTATFYRVTGVIQRYTTDIFCVKRLCKVKA